MHARTATPTDATAIARIYNQGILGRQATFETRLRTAEDVAGWFTGTHPIVAVEHEGALLAFAATSQWRTRPCYAGIAEFSVYVERGARGRGAGKVAMEALIAAAEEKGFWKLVSGVFPENTASLRLLASVGFRVVGTHTNQARLDGVWKDVSIVERLLPRNQPAASKGPSAPPASVVFACVHNAGRSQMAAAFFNALSDASRARAISAGTKPADRVHPEVMQVMDELGVDLGGVRPQRLTAELAKGAALLVTMGCGDECPVVPGARRDDWPLADPKGQTIEAVRGVRDEVRRRVAALLAAEGWEGNR